jgi:plastocyanin
MVTFSGMAPANAEIDMSGEAVCASKHATTPTTETVVVGDGGGLENVFVYVKEGLESLDFPTPTEAVVIDQDGCMYVPHVIGVQAGQEFTLRNSDGLLHNINASPTENRGFNVSQPVSMEANRSFPTAEIMVPVRCDVHGWMSSYIGVVDHPYFTVSGPDGSVSLGGLPPGDYVVQAWHEMYGTLTQSITVVTGETAELSFEFNADMSAAHVPLGEPIDLMHLEGHRTVDHQ